jgi:large subunit ribosomal protein L21
MDYAVIKVGGKQHKVRDGETLVVDRVPTDVGGTFEPDVLLGDGTKVVVTVLAHERGPKIRIGKYRRRTGYKRHTGFRAATSRIEVAIGTGKKRSAAKAKPETAAPAEVEAAEAEESAVEAAAVETAAVETAEPEAAAVETSDGEPEVEESAEAEEAPEGLPDGYADMTVADIGKAAKSWDRDELEAARTYEEAHAARKGALSAIESALEADTDDEGEES